jgi:ubiquinone/menaquinone biosynthesis C-methylase UbiE
VFVQDPTDRIRAYWDRDSATYDRSASHALDAPAEAAVWRAALRRLLPAPPARVLDVGAGTGALSLLAAGLGYRVTALDLSAGMLEQLQRKASTRGLGVEAVHAPATQPPTGPFDAVIERHVVWTLPDPEGALRSWRSVASEGGRLVLFEGIWHPNGPAARSREILLKAVDAIRRPPPGHHQPYPDEVIPRLPLARLSSLDPLLQAVDHAGWSGVRTERLRDVEEAARMSAGTMTGYLRHRPRYAVIADA